MPSIYDIKPRFQALLRPFVRWLASRGATPNQVTLAALAGSLGVGGLLLLTPAHPLLFLLVPLWLFARMALNAIDGMLAREHGMVTLAGGVLNEVGDVLSDAAVYLPFAVFDTSARWLAVLFVLGGVLTEFCGVLVKSLGATRRFDGPMGKSDRTVVASIAALIGALSPGLLGLWVWLFAGATMLAALTCINRIRRGLAEILR